MSQGTRNSVGCIAMALVLSLGGTRGVTLASADTQNGREGSRADGGMLEGTWYTEVTVHDCQSGAILRTFPAFNTFAQGGTLTDTTTAVSPALRSPGHGTWERTGHRAFKSMSVAFLFSPTGVWTGTQRITQEIHIGSDRDQADSDASSQVFDTKGVLTATLCPTAILHRVE
jgi:hypothetical protein